MNIKELISRNLKVSQHLMLAAEIILYVVIACALVYILLF